MVVVVVVVVLFGMDDDDDDDVSAGVGAAQHIAEDVRFLLEH